LRSLPQALRQPFESLWQRFSESLSLCREDWSASLAEKCRRRDDLPAVWAASDFVANSCIRRPILLRDLIDSGDLDRAYCEDHLPRFIARELTGIKDEEALHSRLRQLRSREMVRLAWRDLGGLADVDETMRDVSILADTCIRQSLKFHYDWLLQRFGTPTDDLGEPVRMVVLGLGKLGGRELNFSSDIDLVFAYESGGETVNPKSETGKSISNQEFFTRLGRKIIAALDPLTADGFVFRTDMRLRPNGDSGPLVLSLPAMEHYYQTHGRAWERYALIKARVVAGDDRVGQELIAMLRPFVYRKYLDFGAFDSIREMKRMIQRELRKKGMEDDIKLGRGGIREIEFLIQSHQLIRGGREVRLQTASIYRALSVLRDLGVIDQSSTRQLIEGYRFLRNTEHRLQMVADRQTQRLPTFDLEQIRLAWSMGFRSWEHYLEKLNHHRQAVHRQFASILQLDQDENSADSREKETERTLADIWLGTTDGERSDEVLSALGFSSSQTVLRVLGQFREGRLYQAFSGSERDRIDRLMPLSLKEAAKHQESERAITAFIAVLESIGRRTVYLSLLIENPVALKQLLHLCAASPWISRYIGRHPVIMDELLHPIVDIRHRGHGDIESELSHRLAQLDENDEEGQMNTLREFHHAHVLRVAAADVLNVLEVEDVHKSLTQLAEVLLHHSFQQALAGVRKKQDIAGFCAGVIAYGKFASGELGYHSDLDVVVCFEKEEGDFPQKPSDAEYFYSRVGRRLIHLLTTRTQAGALYDLDMRLRPSGRSGTLVTSLNGFVDYQLKSAWTWEHQALVRARAVVGNTRLVEKFEQVRARVLCLERDQEQLKKDIVSMRQKMIDANCRSTKECYDIKLDQGGIVDIEFLVQYWILNHASTIPELTSPRTTSDSIRTLIEQHVIPDSVGQTLAQAYQRYLRRSLDLKLMDLPVLVPQQDLLESRTAIKSIWKETFG